MTLLLRGALAAVLLVLLAGPAPAAAAPGGLDDTSDQWLPRADGAEWVYSWSNSDYSPTPRKERYVVQARSGTSFRLKWDEFDLGPFDTAASGTIDYKHTDAGLVNLNYQSTQPPPQFPILCASATECGNSLAGTHYMLIWGTRSPALSEPLLSGTRWNSLGGAGNDVASSNRYLGQERVVVPAFPAGVLAAKVESEVTQAGAIGDPFGSGVRTVHWVRGVGPVKIVFRHAGGEVSRSELISTNRAALPLPPDVNLLPLNRGDSATYRWRNSKHMRSWSRQRFDVTEVVNNTARVDVKRLSGPINVAGGYTFATRLSGVTHLSGFTRAATRAKFPLLGPRGADDDNRRRFVTPFDLMVYGFNPVVPVYAKRGESWRSSRESRDWRIFGVTGVSKIIGKRRVRTPAGSYRAVVVRSTLRQRGFPFGSGTRTSWFAPGKGLVKLVFRHRDGSVSTVQRTH
jgi:hypothetical protein